jgi:hypothetical protein
MAYESRPLRRQKIRYNSANSDALLRHQLVLDGAKQTPDEAPAITIYRPGTATALLTSEAMTLSGTVATYAVDTTTTASWPVETGYRGEVVTTVSSVDYTDVILFDVCKHLLWLDVAVDQLIAIDERVAAMAHNDDDDFSEIIEAVRDKLQLKLETRAIKDGQLLENMILDKSRIAIPARYYVLAAIFEEKRDYEQADRHKEEAQELWRSMVAGIKYDENQDLEEDPNQGGVQSFRLVY